MRTSPIVVVVPLLVVLAGGTGCARSGGASTTLTVTSSESTCDVSSVSLRSGSHIFAVTNKGRDVTEVYVYGKGDTVLGEVEDVGPGTSRNLKVKLSAGSYVVACKPGQKGDGIRTPITVAD
jgi:iron uptake system component EfeO